MMLSPTSMGRISPIFILPSLALPATRLEARGNAAVTNTALMATSHSVPAHRSSLQVKRMPNRRKPVHSIGQQLLYSSARLSCNSQTREDLLPTERRSRVHPIAPPECSQKFIYALKKFPRSHWHQAPGDFRRPTPRYGTSRRWRQIPMLVICAPGLPFRRSGPTESAPLVAVGADLLQRGANLEVATSL